MRDEKREQRVARRFGRLLAPMLALVLALVLLPVPTTQAAEPSDGNPAVETGTLTTTDGTTMVYEVRGDAPGEGSDAPTLVFVHCWACDRSVWREQVDVFAEDYRVVTFDLPGHGEAAATSAGREAWTLDGLADDTVQLVKALDLDHFIFVGHSMGGPVSLLAAAKLASPENAEAHTVEGIVCGDTLHDLEMKPPEEQSKQWISMFENDFEGSLGRMMQATLPGEQNDALREEITRIAVAADRTAVIELMKDFPSLELADEAEAADVPIRCINAAAMQKNMAPDALDRNRRHADYELTVMDDVGHFLQLEKPAEFNEALRSAIESIAGAPDE